MSFATPWLCKSNGIDRDWTECHLLMAPVAEPPDVSPASSNSIAAAIVGVDQSIAPAFVDGTQGQRHQFVSNGSSPDGIPDLSGLDTQAQVCILCILPPESLS